MQSPAGVHRSVQFVDTPPVMSDGSVFLGSRYLRQESKNRDFNEPSEVEDEDDDVVKHLIGREPQLPEQCARACAPQSCRPASVRLLIFQHDPAKAADPLKPHKAREVMLSGQNTYLIGSSPTCDVRVFPSEGIEVQAVHSRITFDGTSFVLQDLSFERNLRRQTRVLLNQRAVRVVRGDWLLLGACALQVTTVTKAFGWDRRSDMKEAAIRLDVLRLSKRKPRTRGIFLPVGFRLISTSGSGASSGSNGWGGSSGGPVMFGKGRDCAAQIFTASLAIEQFSVQLERGTCLLTPKATGINAGTYFLIGRDDPGLPSVNDRSGDTLNTERTQKAEAADVVKCTSKPLLLSENCVFRCGGCELEVIYVKSTAIPTDGKSKAAIEEQEHIQLLSNIPWLQPITHDRKLIVSLVRCGQRQRLVAGDVIYEIGDSANFLFIVIAGEVRLLSLSNSDDTDDMQALTERVTAGGFFGEVSLQSPSGLYNLAPSSGGLEYTENATATTVCEILAFAKEDFCGYLEIYMDVVRAHLRFVQAQDKLIRVASNDVPWLRGISLQEKRMVAENAEIARYVHGSVLFDDGKLFVPTASFHDSTPQLRGGLLVLTRGKVCIIRNKNGRQRQFKPLENETSEEEQQHLKGVPDVEEEEEDLDEWWNPNDPVIVVGSSSSPTMSNICDLSVRLEAYSTVECLFIAEAHIAHLVPGVSKQELSNDHPAVVQYSTPLASGNSLVTQRSHHSQVVTSGSGDDDSDGSDDDDHHPLGNSDGKGGRRRWRRKKRNKQLLEQTVLETQNDAQIPNALVLYMLAGAHRGDIHVVRNVATIGGWLSGAGIELNDRYVSRSHAIIEYHDNKYWLYDSGSKWGTFVRLEEEKVVDVHPGNVFLAGEVEFTCLGSFPERNKSSICCIM
ncbi:hypothetical protein BBO99_00002002 [Phytophthora kernoviae]|uniref:FHA domain-containing protein n=2 Tax=Phytophthora kernoviae TaxID=325452 RepID=A0A421EZI0_9STRA|nr:hypothetical protein G195_000867 [Phytophthora kernoviae 00238/432]KAG2532840.1 hypothetical protein JM16_000007 [Phytophthora kernoviae]RLN11086.1 hypothetical protein BBI17_000211 [Phytophthora kernoviae]RLN86153.1 hypothetical protein BBO99_00002002 [Phytophthora kernoviae]